VGTVFICCITGVTALRITCPQSSKGGKEGNNALMILVAPVVMGMLTQHVAMARYIIRMFYICCSSGTSSSHALS
ncbi:hypothetical protein F4775DRAFT_546464, partial [Biscogniauxia sp. FL1348]